MQPLREFILKTLFFVNKIHTTSIIYSAFLKLTNNQLHFAVLQLALNKGRKSHIVQLGKHYILLCFISISALGVSFSSSVHNLKLNCKLKCQIFRCFCICSTNQGSFATQAHSILVIIRTEFSLSLNIFFPPQDNWVFLSCVCSGLCLLQVGDISQADGGVLETGSSSGGVHLLLHRSVWTQSAELPC